MKNVFSGLKDFVRRKVPQGGTLWHVLVFPQRFRRHGFRLVRGLWETQETRNMVRPLKTRKFQKDHVSIVITSAGRKEYLERTIKSLQEYFQSDSQKTRWLIIDDYPNSQETREYIKSLRFFETVIFNERNKGLGYSLNRIFAEVQTEFVFYCQEDYEILRPFSVQEMIEVLRQYPYLSQLMLLGDNPKKYTLAQQVSEKHRESPEMFGFWPYLASMEFFRKNLPFPLYFTNMEFSFQVHKRGWRISGIFGAEQDSPYVRHIGEQRRVWVVK